MEELRCRRCGCKTSAREASLNQELCFVCKSDIEYRDPLANGSASSNYVGAKNSRKPTLDDYDRF